MEPIANPAPATGFTPRLRSGVEAVDRAWGGFYRGGSYLVYGRATSGRDLMTLRFTQMGTEEGESCLFISPMRPKDLIIQAASIGFDLRQRHEQGLVKLMRIPPAINPQGEEDENILKALDDLVQIVQQHRPQRLVINDFMPFVLFRSLDRLRGAFMDLLERMDALDMTTMLVMSEPANAQSKRVVDFIASQMTASIHIEMEEGESTQRRLTLMPNIGHVRRRVEVRWDLADLVEPAADIAAPLRMLSTESAPSAPDPVLPPPSRGSFAIREIYRGVRLGAAPAPNASGVRAIPLGGAARRASAEEPSAPVIPSRIPLGAGRRMGPAPEPRREAAPPLRPITSEHSGAPFHRQAGEIPPAPYLHFDTGPAPQKATPRDFSDRKGFAARLSRHFSQRDAGTAPFLLIAMRLDRRSNVGPLGFEFLSDLVAELLHPHDDLFLDLQTERLIVFLGNSRNDASQAFFSRLKGRLREEAPQQAEGLLQAVSAIVVADGQPFGTAEEFLAYALDKV